MAAVQIAISVYRQHEDYLRQCIKSALGQTFPDLAIAVRTDGPSACSDSALKWIRRKVLKDPRLTLVEGVKRIGIYGSYNSLFRQSSTPYLLQLDADDYLDAFAVEMLMSELDSNSAAVMSFGDCLEVAPNGRPLRIRNNSARACSMNLLNHFFCFHPRLVRRSSYNLVGGYSEDYRLASDYDLCLKLDEIGDIRYVHVPLGFHRVHPHSASMLGYEELNLESVRAVKSALVRRGLDDTLEVHHDPSTGEITLSHSNVMK